VSEAGIIESTRRWVDEVVVADSLCPFATGLLEADLLGIRVAPSGDAEGLLLLLAEECGRLRDLQASQLETSLVVHPGLFDAFEEQLDFLAAVEGLLEQLGLTEVLQVVSFHPAYRFEDAPEDDPANYTNRAPLGMFHLLRRDSVERALAGHADPDSIWRRNVELLRERGSEACEAKLEELRALAKA
jgi:hypothetical protein